MLEISVLMAQFPSREIAELLLRYRTLGLGYANLGGLLMAIGHRLRQRRRAARSAARSPRCMTGIAYATSAEMAGELGPFPGYAENREAMLRVIRNHRRAAHGDDRRTTRGWRSRRCRSTPRNCPDQRAGRGRAPGLGRGAGARRAARLPQRPGHGDRADRHDRPGHGLRHHRHRARFRAGQVQEAGRRRLFQDHQPPGAAGAGDARLQPQSEIADDRPLRGRATARWTARPAINHETLRGQGLRRRGARAASRRRCRRPSTSSSRSTSGPWAKSSAPERSASTAEQLADPASTCWRRSASRAAEIDAANTYCCGAMTARRRAAPEARASARCSTAPTRAAGPARAASRSTATSA